MRKDVAPGTQACDPRVHEITAPRRVDAASRRAGGGQESGQVGVEFGTNALGVIFHLLFYLNHVAKLGTYFVPRFMYQRSSTSGPLSGTDFITNAYDVSGSFGVQYALHRRFSIFGEVGLLIRDTTSNTSPAVLLASSVTTVRPLSGIGAILYFK
jgi:hypothetical protein